MNLLWDFGRSLSSGILTSQTYIYMEVRRILEMILLPVFTFVWGLFHFFWAHFNFDRVLFIFNPVTVIFSRVRAVYICMVSSLFIFIRTLFLVYNHWKSPFTNEINTNFSIIQWVVRMQIKCCRLNNLACGCFWAFFLSQIHKYLGKCHLALQNIKQQQQ